MVADPTSSAARQLASRLLEIEAVLLRPDDPFEWSSGLWAPVYCDNRLVIAYPELRNWIVEQFVDVLEEQQVHPEVVVGTATAGIPHASWLADRLEVPMAYVRSSAKEHGRENRIEGRVHPAMRAIVVEDLISTGGSVLEVVRALRDVEVVVERVLALFSYAFEDTEQRFDAAGVEYGALTTFPVLLEVAESRGQLTRQEIRSLERWHQDPEGWSRQREA